LVVVHTYSPIDLIPELIPVLGYGDAQITTPLGIFLAPKMIPPDVQTQAPQSAAIADQQGTIQTRPGTVIVYSV
jgi:uncharacterized membrane protein YkvA (DUF1232 family)